MTIRHCPDPLNSQWLGFAIWFGVGIGPFSKKMSVKRIENPCNHHCFSKFMFSKKATKIDEMFIIDLTLTQQKSNRR